MDISTQSDILTGIVICSVSARKYHNLDTDDFMSRVLIFDNQIIDFFNEDLTCI